MEQFVTRMTQKKIRAIGEKLLAERKAAIIGEKPEIQRSRDLLTLLLKANLNPDLPENQRLSDEDVIARESLPSPNRLQSVNSNIFRDTHVHARWP